MRGIRGRGELASALDLRERIFVGEQGVDPTADRDLRDDEAIHVGAFDGERLVGTCRVLLEGGVGKLGRMAVERTHRRRGIGAALLAEADRVATEAGAVLMVLHAQVQAESVYRRAGYARQGREFLEEGITHVRMEKRLGP